MQDQQRGAHNSEAKRKKKVQKEKGREREPSKGRHILEADKVETYREETK